MISVTLIGAIFESKSHICMFIRQEGVWGGTRKMTKEQQKRMDAPALMHGAEAGTSVEEESWDRKSLLLL